MDPSRGQAGETWRRWGAHWSGTAYRRSRKVKETRIQHLHRNDQTTAGKSVKNFLVESGTAAAATKKTAPTGTRSRSHPARTPEHPEQTPGSQTGSKRSGLQRLQQPLQGGEERAAERLAETRASGAAAPARPDRREAGVSPLSQAGAMSLRTQVQVRSRQRPADPGAEPEPRRVDPVSSRGASGPPGPIGTGPAPNREEETGFEQHSGAAQALHEELRSPESEGKTLGAVE
ncbi:hypothetical protein AOXY_G38121 [Acipenser oxyrinchus oxyrinchus]|uniref:Uncharacterized protein n=1 Tax=Acipenser oxyrinchus oxyrinchus TaxID=40147 RepID=A0AAD8FMT1_ACIOX|nr:hypothetical protein AOXY_G38121 [Acipenser oxyrinchus oxyrinchus]